MEDESMAVEVLADPLDVELRIEELKLLRDGWLDKKGLAPSRSGLEWFLLAFKHHYPIDLIQPYLYPTPEGQLRAEWSLNPWSPSLDIDLSKKTADWHNLNLETDEEVVRNLNLTNDADWEWLAHEVRTIIY